MDIKQRIQDLTLLAKNDRRVWALGGVIVVLGLIMLVTHEEPKKRRQPPLKIKKEVVIDNEGYRDLTYVFRKKLDQIDNTTRNLDLTVRRTAAEQKKFEEQSRGIFDMLVDRMEEQNTEIERLTEIQSAPRPVVQSATGEPEYIPEPEKLEQFGFDIASVPPPPAPAIPVKATVITPGDNVSLKLLTGVNAPVDGTPYPVVFQLNGPVTGPDGSTLELGEARLLAAAQGSESDGRVLFRLTDLALRHEDGRRSVVQVDGWVVGEDGVRGMKGRLIDKLGRLIVATAGISFTAALGSRIDSKSDSIDIDNSEGVTINSDDIEVAYSSALTDASNRLGQILLDRYEKLVPVVEVFPGREVVAVFSQPAEIEVFTDDDESGYLSSLD